MKSVFDKIPQIVAALIIIIGFSCLLPHLSWASGGSAQFYVSAWLVRLWLALICGTAIVIGVMLALDSYAASPSTEPVLTPEAKVILVKKHKLSYRKIGGGLLCVFVGSALFVTTVFLLPDKRTGHSGIGKIAARFKVEQNTSAKELPRENSMPSGH